MDGKRINTTFARGMLQKEKTTFTTPKNYFYHPTKTTFTTPGEKILESKKLLHPPQKTTKTKIVVD
jgi:hypothetical protein